MIKWNGHSQFFHEKGNVRGSHTSYASSSVWSVTGSSTRALRRGLYSTSESSSEEHNSKEQEIFRITLTIEKLWQILSYFWCRQFSSFQIQQIEIERMHPLASFLSLLDISPTMWIDSHCIRNQPKQNKFVLVQTPDGLFFNIYFSCPSAFRQHKQQFTYYFFTSFLTKSAQNRIMFFHQKIRFESSGSSESLNL